MIEQSAALPNSWLRSSAFMNRRHVAMGCVCSSTGCGREVWRKPTPRSTNGFVIWRRRTNCAAGITPGPISGKTFARNTCRNCRNRKPKTHCSSFTTLLTKESVSPCFLPRKTRLTTTRPCSKNCSTDGENLRRAQVRGRFMVGANAKPPCGADNPISRRLPAASFI